MTIINQNYKLVLNYSPELIHLLKQFFASAEERNQKLKVLVETLQSQSRDAPNHFLLQQLQNHSEETEIDIELVKKLLP